LLPEYAAGAHEWIYYFSKGMLLTSPKPMKVYLYGAFMHH